MLAAVFAAVLTVSAPTPCDRAERGCVVESQIGHRTLRLLVDSGADLVVLTRQGAQRAGIATPADAPKIRHRGVTGSSWATLTAADVSVGKHTEDGVLVSIDPKFRMGEVADGLLGMSFLERFRFAIGKGTLELVPIDEGQTPRPGGRGEAWWRLRFRRVVDSMNDMERTVEMARHRDEKLESEFGSAGAGQNYESLASRLHALATQLHEDLRMKAARAGVPLEWRR